MAKEERPRHRASPPREIIASHGFQIREFRFRDEQLRPTAAALTHTAIIIAQQIGARPGF